IAEAPREQVRTRSPTRPSGKRSTPVPIVWIQRTPRLATCARFGLPQARVSSTSPVAPGGGSPSVGTWTISTSGSGPVSSRTEAPGRCESTRSGRGDAGATATRLAPRDGRAAREGPHADRRRPGALLVRRQPVAGRGRAIAAPAGVPPDAVPLLVEGAAQAGGVHGGRRLLDRAHVVDRLARARRELGVLELDDAARSTRRAREDLPRILD